MIRTHELYTAELQVPGVRLTQKLFRTVKNFSVSSRNVGPGIVIFSLSASPDEIGAFLSPESGELHANREWFSAIGFVEDVAHLPGLLFEQTSAENSLGEVIAESLSKVEEVETVVMISEGEDISVWTIPRTLTEEIENTIYEQELEIIQRFKDLYFEFHIANPSDLADLVKEGGHIIYQRHQ